MVGLQEFIHKLELGEGVKWVRWTAVTLSLVALALVYDVLLFRNLTTEESMDAAQLARNIAQGNGFTTSYIRPFSIYQLQQHRADHNPLIKDSQHPDLANAPLYPLLLAASMKILPYNPVIHFNDRYRAFQPDVIIAILNQVCFFIALFLVYSIGKRLFGKGVAWFAAAILACSELYWRLSLWGGSTHLLLVLLLSAVACLVWLEEGTRQEERSLLWFATWSGLVGLALGLATLTRYSMGWLLLPILGFYGLYFVGRRKTVVLMTSLCFGLVLAPWLMRNYQVSGKLFGIAGYAVYEDSAKYPDVAFQRQLKPEPASFDQFSIEDALRKLSTNLRQTLQNDLPKMGGSWFIALFAAGLFVPSGSIAQGRARVLLLFFLATLLVVQSLGRTHLMLAQPELSSENLIAVIAPLAFIFGAAFCVHLINLVPVAFPEMRILINAGIWAIFSLPLLFSFLPPRAPSLSYPPYFPYIIQRTATVMKSNDLIMSDIPWAIAWYGQRRAIALTLSMPDFIEINDNLKSINALYLTEATFDRPFLTRLVRGDDKVWSRLYLQVLLQLTTPPTFPLRYIWTDIGLRDQLFIADWERWKALKN